MALFEDHHLDQEPSPLITPGGAGCGLFAPHKTVEIGMDSHATLTDAAKAPKSSADQTHIQAHKSGATFSKPSASQLHDDAAEAVGKAKRAAEKAKQVAGTAKASRPAVQKKKRRSGCSAITIVFAIMFVMLAVVGMSEDCFDACDDCLDSCIDSCDSVFNDIFEDDAGYEIVGYPYKGPEEGQFLYPSEVLYFLGDGTMQSTFNVSFGEDDYAFVDLNGDGEFDSNETAYKIVYYYGDSSGDREYVANPRFDDSSGIIYADVDDDEAYDSAVDIPLAYEIIRCKKKMLEW